MKEEAGQNALGTTHRTEAAKER